MRLFDSGIMIDSAGGYQDIGVLQTGKDQLEAAKGELKKALELIAANWKGSAAIQCDQMLKSFDGQIDDLLTVNSRAIGLLKAIMDTYKDADATIARKMSD